VRSPADRADKALVDMFAQGVTDEALTQICCEEYTLVPYNRLAEEKDKKSTRDFLQQFTLLGPAAFGATSKYTILVVFDSSSAERAVVSCAAVHFPHSQIMEISMLKTGAVFDISSSVMTLALLTSPLTLCRTR
jgi:hypothetical protein